MTHFQTAYHGPWRHAARPWTLLPVAHCQYAHCVKRPSTECAESHPPPLSSSRATWVFNPLSVSLHKRTTQARTPPPLSSRLISARFRSKAISAETEGGRGRRRSGRRLTPGWIMDDYRGKWMDRDLAVVRRFTLRAVKFLQQFGMPFGFWGGDILIGY